MRLPSVAVFSAVMQAGAATGAKSELLLAIARRESGFDPLASNQASSALGLMQFTRGAWLDAVRAFGKRHGLAEQAEALAAGGPEAEAAALKLRQDPVLSATLAAERLEQWRQEVEAASGRRAEAADLYLAHLLGPAGARRFLAARRQHPRWSAAAMFPEAARANPGVFHDGRRAFSLAELHRNIASSLTSEEALPLQMAEAE